MDKTAYGPGDQFTINTKNEFHTKFEYKTDDNGKLLQVITTLSQDE